MGVDEVLWQHAEKPEPDPEIDHGGNRKPVTAMPDPAVAVWRALVFLVGIPQAMASPPTAMAETTMCR